LASGRGSVSVEALFMWFKASPTPVPIITDGYANSPDTSVLLGGGTLDTNPNPGFRINGAYAIDSRWGIEASGFYIGSRSASRSVSSTGQIDSLDLLLPFFDVTQNRENVTEISFSPDYRGAAQESLENTLGGGEINVTWALPPRNGWRVDLIGGLRYLQLREDYAITTESPYIPPNPSDIWTTTDQFDTTNSFFGAQAGVRAAFDQGPWVASGTAKLALGNMQQKVSIGGSLVTNDWNDYGATQRFPSGYFALPTNSGDHSRNTFAVVPEIALSVGYRLTPAATVYAGYAFLYASNVVRPGEQINRNVNPTYSLAYGGDPPVKPVGAAQPSFGFNTTDFWAQSLTLGLSIRF
jgi:Putative beta barrel porin-7 (BBP7)